MTASSVPWLNTEDAAHYIGLGVNAFRLLVKKREVAAIRDGGRPRFLRIDLDAYMARQRQPARWESQPARARRSQPTPIRLPSDGVNDITGRPFGTPAPTTAAGGRGRR